MSTHQDDRAGDKVVQRVILCGDRRRHTQHVAVSFGGGAGAQGRTFLAQARQGLCAVTPASQASPELQCSLGVTYSGLEALGMPDPLLAVFQAQAPAYAAGAAVRAATCLGDTGASSARHWAPAYAHDATQAVITFQSSSPATLGTAVVALKQLAARWPGVVLSEFVRGEPLLNPQGQAMVHFDYRDGLSRVAIRGYERKQGEADPHADVTVHAPGEFLLGQPQDNGANPWALTHLPAQLRRFFHHGSFGVLRQMSQNEQAFRAFLETCVSTLRQESPFKEQSVEAVTLLVKAKLAGRWPDGARFDGKTGGPAAGGASTPFNYHHDPHGHGCPFGAHARRMNPRGSGLAHFARARPVLRRGSAYGPRYQGHEDPSRPVQRGLLGWFFCSSIEEQFEHVLGQWADRVPLGSLDEGDAKDPLTGEHEGRGGRFHIPAPDGKGWFVEGFQPFVRTDGTLYLFYPSIVALDQLLADDWIDPEEPRP